jgi:hypothetical protein
LYYNYFTITLCHWYSSYRLAVHMSSSTYISNNENLKSGECKGNTLQNVQVHWKNSLRVDMSLQSDTLSWFRANQTSFLLLMLRVSQWSSKCQCQWLNTDFIVFSLTRSGHETPGQTKYYLIVICLPVWKWTTW